MERDSLLRQLVALRVYGSLTYPFACIPFLWFWFSDHGIDLTEYGILVSAYYAAMFIAEPFFGSSRSDSDRIVAMKSDGSLIPALARATTAALDAIPTGPPTKGTIQC